MAPRRLNKTTPKPSMLTNQRNKLRATRLEAPPATTSGPTYGPGAGRTGAPPNTGNPLGAIRSALALFTGPAATAAEVMRPRPVADGTLRGAIDRGDYNPVKAEVQGQKPPAAPKLPPPRKSQLSSSAQDFDRSFARARAAGLSEFTWRGRRYNTRYAGE